MRVRAFERNQLKNDDILFEFVATLDMENLPYFSRKIKMENPLLSGAGIAVTEKLTQIAPLQSGKSGSGNFLRRIKGPPFVADSTFMKTVFDNNSDCLKILYGCCGLIHKKRNFEKNFTTSNMLG